MTPFPVKDFNDVRKHLTALKPLILTRLSAEEDDALSIYKAFKQIVDYTNISTGRSMTLAADAIDHEFGQDDETKALAKFVHDWLLARGEEPSQFDQKPE